MAEKREYNTYGAYHRGIEQHGFSGDVLERLTDEKWTLNNLYRIIDKEGKDIPFRFNWMQEELYENKHRKKLILKSRQLGSTTFWCVYLLNKALFKKNQRIGIIADRMESAQNIFNKIIKHAYKSLKDPLRNLPQCQLLGDSAREMTFANGSSIRVDTSMRSGTLTSLLITELGKICARSPAKAEEIVAGSLNTLGPNAELIIESTAEGAAGFFYDLCKRYMDYEGELSDEDYAFFFFPWWRQQEYRLSTPYIELLPSDNEYFWAIENRYGIEFEDEQKFWYKAKSAELGDLIRQEFPSYPEEAFQARFEGFYYQTYIDDIIRRNQVCNVPYDPSSLVHTAWDLGYRDSTSIWCFQLVGRSVHIVDFYQNNNKSLQHYLDWLRTTKYNFGQHFVPHDAASKEKGTGLSYEDQARAYGFHLTVLQRESVLKGINAVRNLLPRCWFDKEKTKEGIAALQSYRKAWSERYACYTDTPLHDASSHASDSFRYLAMAIEKLKISDSGMTAEELREVARRNRPMA